MITWDVTMLGSSRVGKTSLLTSLQRAGNDYFRGTDVSVEPADKETRAAFQSNDNLMLGELAQRKFSPNTLPGTRELVRYSLTLKAGKGDRQMTLRFTDFPGGWMHTHEDHDRVLDAMRPSPTVIVPIDATLLIHGPGDDHAGRVVEILQLTALAEKLEAWADYRTQQGDPAKLILVPVKCESFFNDNGGRADKSGRLLNAVQAFYGDAVDRYRAAAGRAGHVLYAPVDTIGPIELVEAEWTTANPSGLAQFVPTYRVRSDGSGRPVSRVIMGAEPVLAQLVHDAVDLHEEFLREEKGDIQAQGRRRRSNWFKRIYDDWSGNKEQREGKLRELDDGIERMAESVNSATQMRGPQWARVRQWN
jgi:hypothetical protein